VIQDGPYLPSCPKTEKGGGEFNFSFYNSAHTIIDSTTYTGHGLEVTQVKAFCSSLQQVPIHQGWQTGHLNLAVQVQYLEQVPGNKNILSIFIGKPLI
jgi:hypothetical protein